MTPWVKGRIGPSAGDFAPLHAGCAMQVLPPEAPGCEPPGVEGAEGLDGSPFAGLRLISGALVPSSPAASLSAPQAMRRGATASHASEENRMGAHQARHGPPQPTL